jgi:hypothetical protein
MIDYTKYFKLDMMLMYTRQLEIILIRRDDINERSASEVIRR